MASQSQLASRLARQYVEAHRNGRLYAALANDESDNERAELYRRISENEAALAQLWLNQIQRNGEQLRVRWSVAAGLFRVAAHFMPSHRAANLLQRRHRRWLSLNHDLLEDNQSRQRAVDTAETLTQLANRPQPDVDHESDHPEHGWLASSSGTLRAAVLGLNDGLVSNFSLTMGIAGATSDASTVLVAGLAGLIAGALSMAAGEYVSVKSQNEYYANLIQWERAELALWSYEETRELQRIYESKGLNPEEAHTVATRIMSDPEVALDTHVREELGIDPDDLGGSPWAAAISSLGAFAFGAVIPVIPYAFGAANAVAIAISAVASLVALTVVGSALGWMSGTSAVLGGFRMAAIGLAAAALTYLLGLVVGTQLTG